MYTPIVCILCPETSTTRHMIVPNMAIENVHLFVVVWVSRFDQVCRYMFVNNMRFCWHRPGFSPMLIMLLG